MGRYFVSLIRKLQQLKKRENISVDENFKLQLRSQLVERAAVLKATPGMQSAGSLGGIFERFLKWRYQLAVIPVFLLLVGVVTATISNLPVLFHVSKQTSKSVSPVPPKNNILNTAATDVRPETLPGMQPQAVPSSSPVPMVQSTVPTIMSTPVPTLPPIPILSAPAPQPTPTTSPIATPVPAPASTPVPMFSPAPMPTAQPPKTAVPNSSTAPIASHMQNYPIEFSGTFSSDEKTLLTKEVIPRFVQNRAVRAVTVRQQSEFKVTIEVRYADGTFSRYLYTFGARIR